MPVELRPYQKDFVRDLFEGIKRYNRVIACAGTGSGKSVVMGYMIDKFVEEGKRVLVMTSRIEIMTQNWKHIANFGNKALFVNPQVRQVPNSDVVVAMSQTLRRRISNHLWQVWLGMIDVLIIDEAHESHSDFVHQYIRRDCAAIGFTGTPARYGSSTEQLGRLYSAIVYSIPVKELVNKGYLARPRLYSIAAPSLKGCGFDHGRGDYKQAALAQCFEKHNLYTNLVGEWKRVAKDKRTLIFCVSSAQAIALTQEFCYAGVKAKYLLSADFDTDAEFSDERSKLLRDFEEGEVTVLCNVGIAVAGLDIVNIECVVLNFATVSVSKYRQSIGRGARVTPTKKDFIIIDAGENYKRLGRYEDDVKYCLWHDVHVSDENSLGMQKQCPNGAKDGHGHIGCGQFIPVSCKVCPNCGYEFPKEKKKSEAELYLEEIAAGDTTKDLNAWAANKYIHEGWKLPRIMIQVCLANPGQERQAFTSVYQTMFPDKNASHANNYWHQFRVLFWNKIKPMSREQKTQS